MDFSGLKKNLRKDVRDLPVVRVAVLCNFASQLLVEALKGHGIEERINYEFFEADYDQIERQILDHSSQFYEYKPQFAIVLSSSEKLLLNFYKTAPEERVDFAQKQAKHAENLYNAILAKANCNVIMNTFPEIDDQVFGNFSTKIQSSFPYQVKYLNILLMDLTRNCRQLFLADFNSVIARMGQNNSFDTRLYINADMVFGLDILPSLAKNLHDVMQAVRGNIKKCLILDLDNTIWGGVIGDDGMEGIQIGSLGIGKAYTNLQFWAKELRNRGIILAVCSKNSESVAKEPFESHPDMILRLDDIAVFVANWDNKVDNIMHIQSILNIGFDSMVFLDDNPFERNMVKKALPDLTIPDLPEDPAEYMVYLKNLNLFETASFTSEDKERTTQYQIEAKRQHVYQSYSNEREFLESLQMQSEVKAFDQFIIPRIAQLSQRSNQFNLRTIRYSEEQLGLIAANKDYFTFSFTLQDVFGDSGIVSAVILKKQGQNLFVDTWIMSCRVLKRGLENFVLNSIATVAKDNNFKNLVGEYIATSKNAIVKNHYSNLGFSRHGDLDILSLSDFKERETLIKYKLNGQV